MLFVQADAGAPRFKAELEKLGMDVAHLMAERFEVWAPDAEQGASGFKASIPGFIQIRKALEEKQFDAVIIDSVKGMCSGTGFDYAERECQLTGDDAPGVNRHALQVRHRPDQSPGC